MTVVIPVHNRAAMLRRALGSVAAQAPSGPAEVIVVDDASSDDTAGVAESMGVAVIRHARNRGGSVARNTGIAAAAHPWIALLDSDDEWCPHHLDALWRLRAEHVLVAASVLVRSEGQGNDRFSGPVTRRPVVLNSPATLVYPQNFVAPSATMMRRQALLDVGGYRAELRLAEDLDLLLRLLERGTGIVTPSIGAIYHEHQGQLSSERRQMRTARENVAGGYLGRAWASSSLLTRMSGAIVWDELRAALAQGQKQDALDQTRLLLSHPQRALGVTGLLAWRRLGRRRASAMRSASESTRGGIFSAALEALLVRALDLVPLET